MSSVKVRVKVDVEDWMVNPNEVLLQEAPFIFVDKIVTVSDEEIICLKHLAHNEPYFKGHFPKNPILPGVLMVEMAAQASLILTTYKQNKFKFNEDSDSKQEGYLVKTNNFTFYNKAKPGDSLKIRVRLTQNTGNYYTASALISFADSNGRVAKGELVFYLPSKEETKNVN